MKERPIIQGYEIAGRMPVFQQWGRQAIRNGQKTQTRRPLRKQPLYVDEAPRYLPNEWCLWDGECSPNGDIVRCPYGQPGDIRVMTEPLINLDGLAYYFDDGIPYPAISNVTGKRISWRWKVQVLSSLFMPYEAARTLTRYTNVRVERVQQISRDDCIAEGCASNTPYIDIGFRALWNEINEKRGYPYLDNSWVWVLEFERVEK